MSQEWLVSKLPGPYTSYMCRVALVTQLRPEALWVLMVPRGITLNMHKCISAYTIIMRTTLVNVV